MSSIFFNLFAAMFLCVSSFISSILERHFLRFSFFQFFCDLLTGHSKLKFLFLLILISCLYFFVVLVLFLQHFQFGTDVFNHFVLVQEFFVGYFQFFFGSGSRKISCGLVNFFVTVEDLFVSSF